MAVQCTIPGPSWVLVSKLGSQREVLFVCAGASRGNDVVPDPLRASACCRYFSGGGGRRGDGGGRICTVSHMTSPGVPTGAPHYFQFELTEAAVTSERVKREVFFTSSGSVLHFFSLLVFRTSAVELMERCCCCSCCCVVASLAGNTCRVQMESETKTSPPSTSSHSAPLHFTVTSCYITLRHILLCYVKLRLVTLHYVLLHYMRIKRYETLLLRLVTSHYVTSRYVMLRKLCIVMSCYITSH